MALQVVLITGCSKCGLGHALALAFARAGCTVVATARSVASMDHLEAAHPNIQTLLQLDVTSADSRADVVASVLAKHRRIDILVNNAGILRVGPMAELPPSDLEHTFATNVFAPLELIQAVVPHMIARRSGKIVNIGSVSGFTSGPWVGAYSASKAALHALSDSLRVELKPFGIDVIVVAPGAIKSKIDLNCIQSQPNVSRWNIYAPWEKFIRYAIEFSQSTKSTDTEEFAQKTVQVILKKRPTSYFIIGYLSINATILYYLPTCVRDYFFAKEFGLNVDLSSGKNY